MDLRNRRLPKAYLELEYLESTGTQWIDTGYIRTGDENKVEIKFKYAPGQTETTIFGYSHSSIRTPYISKYWTNEGTVAAWGTSDQWLRDIPAPDDVPHVFVSETNENTRNWHATMDGVEIYNGMFPHGTTTIAGITSTLFGVNVSTPANPVELSSARIYYYKEWDNGFTNLVRNMIPAKRKHDSVLGMYDLVTETFFTNKGGGVFTAGPTILTVDEINIPELPTSYTELDFIGSNGNQYIDTGFKATSMNLKVETTITRRNNNSRADGNYFGFNNMTTDSNWYTLYRYYNSNKSTFWAGISNGEQNTVFSDSLGRTFYHLVIETTHSGGSSGTITCYCDGNLVVNNTFEGSFIENPGNFMLFTVGGYAMLDRLSEFRMKKTKIWQDNILVRNMIPAKRNSDNEIGMYDLVTKQFLTNAGSGEFTAGFEAFHDVEQLSLPYTGTKYEFYEYLESTGNGNDNGTYIDSGWKVNQSKFPIEIETTFSYTELNKGAIYGLQATGYSNWFYTLYSPNSSSLVSSYIGQTPNVPFFDRALDTKYDVKVSITSDTVTRTVNGVTDSFTYTPPINEEANLFIFAGSHGIYLNDCICARIYNFKIKENGVLVRNFLPAKRLSDNELGMYDAVEDKFYADAGPGYYSFTVGSVSSQVPVWTKTPDLPLGYTRKNYLQSSGTQYIDTGLKAKATHGIHVKSQYTSLVDEAPIISASGSAGAHDVVQYYNGGVRVYMGSPYSIYNLEDISTSEIIELRINTNIPTSYDCYMNNIKMTTDVVNPAFIDINYNWWLFVRNVEGSPYIGASEKIWFCKIYDSGVLVRDLIPAMRNSDSVLGMYDTCTDTFFTNAGSGEFTAG